MKGNPVPIVDHNKLTNLAAGDVHTQYAYLLGRSGGQIWNLGLDSGDGGEIHSTAHGTKGILNLCDFAYFDEVNNRMGIGTNDPSEVLDLASGNMFTLGKLALGTTIKTTEQMTVQTPQHNLSVTGTQSSALIRARANSSVDTGAGLTGLNASCQTFGSSNYTGAVGAVVGKIEHVGIGTINFATGVTGSVVGFNGLAGEILNARAFSAAIDAEEDAIGTAIGLYVPSFSVDTGSIDNAYGIYLLEQTNATNNWSLYIEGGASFMGGTLSIDGDIVLPKASGKGIKIDNTIPTFGWRDLLGSVEPKTIGAGKATLGAFRGGKAKAWFYDLGDTLDTLEYHIPHDYVPGTDLYIHLHWGHHGTAISGSLVITFGATCAKGHNQQDFPAEVAPVLTVSTPNIATIPQYRHRVDEIQLSASSPSATQLNNADIEPDTVILIGFEVTTEPTITGGVVNKTAFFEIDIHYQSTNIATKDKTPDFYT